jgi:Holliday junction resolvasome RuvABC endonuclease subunit
MKILSLDPGKNHFAWAYINSKGKCAQHGFVRTITTMEFAKICVEIDRFTADIEKLLDRFELGGSLGHAVVLERMQHRPKFGGGAVVEYMNVMIGIVLLLARQRKIQPMAAPPGTWKKHIRGVYNLKPKDLFTMSTQKLSVKAPKGMMRKHKGKMVQVKKTTMLVKGVLAGQPGHDDAGGGEQLTPHEGDAVAIGCFCWARMTGLDIVRTVLS